MIARRFIDQGDSLITSKPIQRSDLMVYLAFQWLCSQKIKMCLLKFLISKNFPDNLCFYDTSMIYQLKWLSGHFKANLKAGIYSAIQLNMQSENQNMFFEFSDFKNKLSGISCFWDPRMMYRLKWLYVYFKSNFKNFFLTFLVFLRYIIYDMTHHTDSIWYMD